MGFLLGGEEMNSTAIWISSCLVPFTTMYRRQCAGMELLGQNTGNMTQISLGVSYVPEH